MRAIILCKAGHSLPKSYFFFFYNVLSYFVREFLQKWTLTSHFECSFPRVLRSSLVFDLDEFSGPLHEYLLRLPISCLFSGVRNRMSVCGNLVDIVCSQSREQTVCVQSFENQTILANLRASWVYSSGGKTWGGGWGRAMVRRRRAGARFGICFGGRNHR